MKREQKGKNAPISHARVLASTRRRTALRENGKKSGDIDHHAYIRTILLRFDERRLDVRDGRRNIALSARPCELFSLRKRDADREYRNFVDPDESEGSPRNKRSSRVILYRPVFGGKCDKSALVTYPNPQPPGLGERPWCAGAGSMPEYENSEDSSPRLLSVPFLPSPTPRHVEPWSHIHIRALLPAVESTASVNERANADREKETEGERGKGVDWMSQFQKVQFLYRPVLSPRPPPSAVAAERNFDRS